MTIPARASQTVTVAPANPQPPNNCYPFGLGRNWTPFFGFIYKNVPAFQLKAGDSLSFDLGGVNDADVQLQIDLAATTVNGGDAPSQPFTTVVANTQTPANPRGDTTTGNFELAFTALAPFNFAGGGLIIRFSSPSASFALDAICTAAVVETDSTDPSGYFVKRFYADTDGLPPYDLEGNANLGGFRLTLADVPVTPPPNQPVKKKKCKKKKHHSAESAKKKKCKKKKHG